MEVGDWVESLLVATNAVMPMFLFMALGYLLKKGNIVDEEFLKKLNSFCFQVFFPVLVFSNVYDENISSFFNPKLLIYAVGLIFFLVIVGTLVVVKTNNKNAVKGVLIQAVFRSNMTLFGLSLGASVYGKENLAPMAVVVVAVVPIFNILSVIVLETFRGSTFDIKRILGGIVTNPLIVGAFLALAVNILNIDFPEFVDITIEEMQAATLPIALIVLGGTLKFSSISKNLKYLVPCTIIRLVIAPIIGVLGGLFLGFRGIEIFSIYVLVGTPVAVASYAMTYKMEGDYELAGQLIAITTIFSVLTMFIFIFVMKHFGLI